MGKIHKLPGTPGGNGDPGPPIPPGGVDLSGLGKILEGPKPTSREVNLQSCNLGIVQDLDGKKVLGYQLIIIDPFERTTYHLKFNQEMRESFKEALDQLGDIGDEVEVDE